MVIREQARERGHPDGDLRLTITYTLSELTICMKPRHTIVRSRLLTDEQQSTDAFKSLIPNMSSIELNEKTGLRDMHVVTLNSKDDHDHMPQWKRTLFLCAPFLCILTLVAYWTYFTLRIIFVISSQRQTGKTFPMAWVFIGTEIAVAVPLFIQTLWNVFILKRRNRPQLRLVGEDVPSVDVFVTCCKEEVDLIIDTVRAACEIDYPRERYRVVVLDDGGDKELETAVNMLAQSCNYQNLHYRSREKIPGVPHHFKAGNLNYGLDEVCHMYGGASSYMAALDAGKDFALSKNRNFVTHDL